MLPRGTPDLVSMAFDLGINFFFVSGDLHWPLYETLRVGIARLLERGGGIRDDIVVAVVSYVGRAQLMRTPYREALEAIPSLKRVDVCVAGAAYKDDLAGQRTQLIEHRTSSYLGCRAIGVSYHDRRAAIADHNDGSVDIGFVRYNALHPGAREDVFPFLTDSATLLFGFKAADAWIPGDQLARQGLPHDCWRPQPTDHYRFALTRPELDGLLCAPQTASELRSLVDAMDRGPLDERTQAYLECLALVGSGDAEIVS